MNGYKVVNYHRWESLPDIFNSSYKAENAKKKWKHGKEAIIEKFNSKSNYAKIWKHGKDAVVEKFNSKSNYAKLTKEK